MFKFADIAPEYMEVELHDGTILHVYQPTKEGFDRFPEFDELLKDNKYSTGDGAEKIYELFAFYLSNNKENIKFEVDDIRNNHTLGHALAFIRSYTSYVFKVIANPN